MTKPEEPAEGAGLALPSERTRPHAMPQSDGTSRPR